MLLDNNKTCHRALPNRDQLRMKAYMQAALVVICYPFLVFANGLMPIEISLALARVKAHAFCVAAYVLGARNPCAMLIAVASFMLEELSLCIVK
eukprot:4725784-Amphidinium_carterae.1